MKIGRPRAVLSVFEYMHAHFTGIFRSQDCRAPADVHSAGAVRTTTLSHRHSKTAEVRLRR